MRKSKFSEDQISSILKEGEAGFSVAEICTRHGISPATWYRWRNDGTGGRKSLILRLRELQAENNTLKHLCTELARENAEARARLAVGRA